MCSECLQTPCDPRCPNAEPTPREPVATCGICNDDIFAGDDVVEIDGSLYHYDCLEKLPLTELLDMCGVYVDVAIADDT